MRWLPFAPRASQTQKANRKKAARSRKLVRLSIVSLIASGLVVGILSWSGLGHAQGSLQITGTVTDPSNQGVNDVSVFATDPGGSTADYGPVTSGSDGSYELDVDPGTYDFHFVPPSGSDLGTVVEHDVTVTSSQVINVQFATLYTLSGTITDSSDATVPANVEVRIYDSSTDTTATAYTNSSGYYSMSAAPGDYALSVIDETGVAVGDMTYFTLTPNGVGIDLTSGDVTKNLQIDTATVHVTVENASGSPLSGVTVTGFDNASGTTSLYTGDPGESMQNLNAQATTASGTADITSIVGAQYGTTYAAGSICADISGAQVCLASPLTVTGDTDVVIQQPSSYTLSGTITDSSDATVPANVEVRIYDSSTDTTATAYTNSSGYYSMSAAPGDYALSVIDETGVAVGDMTYFTLTPNGVGIDLTSGDVTKNLQIDTATVHVTVENASGSPLSGVTVTGFDNASGTTSLYTGDPGESMQNLNAQATTASGTADITSIVGAQYGTTYAAGSICADISGAQVCLASPLTVTGDTDVVIQQPSSYTLSGTITDSSDATVPANVEVRIYDSSTDTTATAYTNSSGYYSMSAAPGDYALSVIDETGVAVGDMTYFTLTPNGVGIDLTSGDVTKNLQIDTATVHVTVENASGSPLSGVTVTGFDNASGTTSLYTGDPGESMQNLNAQATTASGTADITSIVGAQYGTTYAAGSICADISGAQVCLASPLTVTGDTTIVIQETLADELSYFTANNGSTFSRQTAPFTSGVATQTINSDGSITVNVNDAPGYADSGFYLYKTTLGDLPNFTVNSSSGNFGLNLWFDNENLGDFFQWNSSGVLTGLGGDTYGLSPGSTDGTLTVNGDTSFFMMDDGQNYTLSQLIAGDDTTSGINADTPVTVWVGVDVGSGGSTSATISSITGL